MPVCLVGAGHKTRHSDLRLALARASLREVTDDNRQAQRFTVEVKVDYRTVGSFITDYTTNVSKKGLFVRTSLPLRVGERVRLRLTLPEGDAPFALDGIVKWTVSLKDEGDHPPGMGIEFVNYDEQTEEQLSKLVAACNAADS